MEHGTTNCDTSAVVSPVCNLFLPCACGSIVSINRLSTLVYTIANLGFMPTPVHVKFMFKGAHAVPVCMLSLGNIFIVLLFYTLNSENLSVQELLQAQRVKYLPVSRDECQRFHVRRRHVLDDSFLRFNAGFKENKYIKVTFAAEAAVDEGGPLREYFRLLLGEIAKKNQCFVGMKSAEFLYTTWICGRKSHITVLEQC